MNKKIIISIIVCLVIIVACIVFVSINNGSNKSNTNVAINQESDNNIVNENTIENNNEENNEYDAKEKKILIAFFSRADENYNVGNVEVGNTEIMAGFIKDYLGDKADIFKIDPVNPYPTNYKECTEVATEEKNSNARPEFKSEVDISKYTDIIIGYPIWWGDVPMIINTFLEKYDFSSKNIYLFNTHEGSGISGTYDRIKSKMKNSNVNTNGLALQGKVARQESSRMLVEN